MNQYHIRESLSLLICDHIDDVLSTLGVHYHKSKKVILAKCPVHGGDNNTALNLYADGDIRPFWECQTHHCEKKFKSDIYGFIHGVLSHQRGKQVSYQYVVDWIVKTLGYSSILDIPLPTAAELARKRQLRTMSRVSLAPLASPPISTSTGLLTRERFRSNIIIPSEYYLQRGYSKEILDQYDVGFDRSNNRVAIPVYDNDNKHVVGITLRSVDDKCEMCGLYHPMRIKCEVAKTSTAKFAKWRMLDGFNKSNHLYNYWFALPFIRKSGVVILTEGPGEIWRLEMAGIHNSIALFGVDLSVQQSILLDMSGAMRCVILLNNDEAGKRGKESIQKALKRSFHIDIPRYEGIDVGDLNSDSMKTLIDQLKLIQGV